MGMTDLDKRIAELKGITFDGIWKDPVQAAGGPWSTSDSKALELVDELAKPNLSFMVGTFNGGKSWSAGFALYESARLKEEFKGLAPTRPEAICRAYIAAREWMAKRGKE